MAVDGGERDVVNLANSHDTKGNPPNLLPCSIKYDGPANVSTYLLATPQGDSMMYEASFRGRRLCGRRITLPASYTGHIVVETVSSQDTNEVSAFEADPPASPPAERRELKSVENFESLIVWEHDRVPLDDDEFVASLEWIDAASSIHADCTNSDDTKADSA